MISLAHSYGSQCPMIGKREPRIEELTVRGDQGEEQRAEGDEDEPVRNPDLGPLQHPGVPESLGEHVPPPLATMITAAGSRACRA